MENYWSSDERKALTQKRLDEMRENVLAFQRAERERQEKKARLKESVTRIWDSVKGPAAYVGLSLITFALGKEALGQVANVSKSNNLGMEVNIQMNRDGFNFSSKTTPLS